MTKFKRAARLGATLGNQFRHDAQRLADEIGLVVRPTCTFQRELTVYVPPGAGGWSALLFSAQLTGSAREQLIAACCGAQLLGPIPDALFIARFQRHPLGLAFAAAFLEAETATVDWRTRAMRAHIA